MAKTNRSNTAVCFDINNGDVELVKTFLKEADENGIKNMDGYVHRGGVRACIFGPTPMEAVHDLTKFLEDFRQKYQSSTQA